MKKLLLAILAIGFTGSTLCDVETVKVRTNPKSNVKYLTKKFVFLPAGEMSRKKVPNSVSVDYDGQQYTLDKQCEDHACGNTNCPWYYHNPSQPQCKAYAKNPILYYYTELK